MPLTDKQKRYVKLAVKLSITGTALYFVFTKIDVQAFREVIATSNWWYFALAVLAFNGSKLIASFRLKSLYTLAGAPVSTGYNIRLYYLGMFYNLFLPGSIGGDGYKVYILRQQFDAKVKDLISASVIDRLSGLSLLVILGCGLAFAGTFSPGTQLWKPLAAAVLVLTLPAFYLGIRLVWKKFVGLFARISLLSLVVQLGQLLCALCLLASLSAQGHWVDYLTLFMISSVVAVIPFTIGGVGARELVFLYGYQYLHIDEATSIAFTLLFFGCTAITALSGLLFAYNIDTAPVEKAGS